MRMPYVSYIVAAWVAFLVAAIPYTRHARHPQMRLGPAWLLFVSLFSVSAAMLFFVLGWLAAVAGLADALARPAGAALFIALVFLPAFYLARWQLKRPPRQVLPP